MKQRPTSITMIAWLLIVIGGLSLITSTLTIHDPTIYNPMVREMLGTSPIPVPIQFGIFYLGLLVVLISGVFLLRGKAWARILLVAWSGVGFLVGFITSPMKTAMIPEFVIFVVILSSLFRPSANAFFSRTLSSDPRKRF